ncbi:Mu transposase C-terminal domain-containing protein [Roseobacter sinensis]|uniref:Mu transposase C-terminal domain-containing protein n=1 Tax=Roseobacter sinensis TaxID=2931391 RepID=A0ABT3BLL9_9RHOB|nr:Mu transposase C-terminal domain-containing protein [Roseobacter sp. WL0113]MCV3274133.1 Mu transposase C-terminal domain-containing protein [Roseobacter sp. WL0113]
MRKSLFTRFDRISIDNQSYRFQSQDKEHVLLERLDVGGAIERLRYDEIEQYKAAKRWSYERGYFKSSKPNDQPGRPMTKLASLPEETRALTLYRATVCNVMRDLYETGEITLREPSLNENRDRIESLVNKRELARHNPGRNFRAGASLPVRKLPCARTILELFRWWRDGDYCTDRLIPKYGGERQSSISIDHEKEEFLRQCVTRYASPDGPTMELVIGHTMAQFDKENERRRNSGQRLLGTVSPSTVRRRIRKLDPFLVTYHRQGAEAARRQAASYGAGLQTVNPMERIEIDEWLCDVRTLFAKLAITQAIPVHVLDQIPKGRRWVCCAIDCATKCILGVRIAERPSSTEARRLLRMVVSDKSDLAKSLGLRNSWPQCGGLGVVATDAASWFHSDEFQVSVQHLHGTPIAPPLEKSELRGSMERFFGSVETGLMPQLPGRTFSNIQAKGDYDSDGSAVLDDNDLAAILISWIVDHYHQVPHKGLDGQSPAGRWNELMNERFVPEQPDRHDIRTALGNPLERTLTNRGIQVCGNHYSCDELREHFAHSRKRRMAVRLDPEDIGAISVEIDGRWFEAKSIHKDLDGVTLDAWTAQHQLVLQRFKDVERLSLETRRRVLDAIRSRRKQAELDRITPGSKTDTSAKIDWLEKNLFHGKSYEPATMHTKFSADDGPFGMEIKPDQATKTADNSKRDDNLEDRHVHQSDNDWRLEDE